MAETVKGCNAADRGLAQNAGLSEYTERFAENGVDISVFRHLTDQDLKDIGVLLGHRRKMLVAIAELPSAVQAKPQPAPAMERGPQDTGELSHL